MLGKISCLILDHDDTVVDSTRVIHYPAYLETMKLLRPHVVPESLDGWFLKNFHPGIMEYFIDELGFSETELALEHSTWRSFVTNRRPMFFPGVVELLHAFKESGGKIVVASHSEADMIELDYHVETDCSLKPDLVFGWDVPDGKRKPSPWPVFQTIKELQIKAEEVLIVDDLKPGVLMARAAGVAIGGAGWGHDIPEIKTYMSEHCDYYFQSIEALRRFVFDPKGTCK